MGGGFRFRRRPDTARYTLRKGELTEAAQGDLSITNGVAALEARIDDPGHLLIEFQFLMAFILLCRGWRLLGFWVLVIGAAAAPSARWMKCYAPRRGKPR